MDTREDVLGQLEAVFGEFDRTVSGLDDDALVRPAVDAWSARDIAAHFAGCHRAMASALKRLATGLDPRDPDEEEMSEDGWNARFVAAGRLMGRAQLLADLRTAFEACRMAAECLPAERFAPGTPATRWIREEIEHYQNHLRELRDGLM